MIPEGKITYTDLIKPEKPIYSKKYNITGKPDYIIEKNDEIIPIEFKTGKHNKPAKNHIFQLAAYCQLIEDNFNKFVPYGLLIYKGTNNQFKIFYNPKIRFELESIIKEMRQSIKKRNVKRNHNDPYKCIKCSMKEHCTYKISIDP